MLIHITLNGKRTSTTLDNLLGELMIVHLGVSAELSGRFGRNRLQNWLQKKVNQAGGTIHGMKPSEWVKATIMKEIVQPSLIDKLNLRRPGWDGGPQSQQVEVEPAQAAVDSKNDAVG